MSLCISDDGFVRNFGIRIRPRIQRIYSIYFYNLFLQHCQYEQRSVGAHGTEMGSSILGKRNARRCPNKDSGGGALNGWERGTENKSCIFAYQKQHINIRQSNASTAKSGVRERETHILNSNIYVQPGDLVIALLFGQI